jgi:hypothetical protein
MIARKDQNMLRIVVQNVTQRLAYCVRCSLIPMGALRSLLSRQNVNEPLGEQPESIGLVDMSIERF